MSWQSMVTNTCIWQRSIVLNICLKTLVSQRVSLSLVNHLSEAISFSWSVTILLRNDKRDSSGLALEIPCWNWRHHHPSAQEHWAEGIACALRSQGIKGKKASEGRVETDQRKQYFTTSPEHFEASGSQYGLVTLCLFCFLHENHACSFLEPRAATETQENMEKSARKIIWPLFISHVHTYTHWKNILPS